MSKNVYWFAIDGDDERVQVETYEDIADADDRSGIAADAAETAYNDHDYHEDSYYPMLIELFETETSESLGFFEVEREWEPTFSACPVCPECRSDRMNPACKVCHKTTCICETADGLQWWQGPREEIQTRGKDCPHPFHNVSGA